MVVVVLFFVIMISALCGNCHL